MGKYTQGKPRILYMEDDLGLARILQKRLQRHGFDVLCAADGKAGLRLLRQHHFDLLIVDYIMPGLDGISVLQAVMAEETIPPIVMLSGQGNIAAAVKAMKLGAADYLIKDMEGAYLDQLPATIHHILKHHNITSAQRRTPSQIIRFAGWTLNLDTQCLKSGQGADVQLTRGEFALLEAFLSRPNRVLSRDVLLDLSRSREAALFDRSIDVQVGRLRRKIETDPKHPAIIKTVRGVGYIFTTPSPPP